MTSEREKLIEAVMEAIFDAVAQPHTKQEVARAALATIYARLREVTPAMLAVSAATAMEDDDAVIADWQAMLAASPLAEGKS